MRSKKDETTEKFLLYLLPKLKARLREEAQKEQRSVNGEVRWILEHYFATQAGSVE